MVLRSFWDQYAAYFEFWNESKFYKALVADTMAEAKVQPGMHCADLGCGTGTISTLLAQQGATVQAVDFSSEMIKRAQANIRRTCTAEQRARIELCAGEAEAILAAWPAERFDLVIASLLVSYLPHYQDVLKDVFRVLKPGGVFLMSNPVPNYAVVLILARSFSDIFRNVKKFLPVSLRLVRYVVQIRKMHRQGTFHFFTQEETRQALQRAGFQPSAIRLGTSFGSQVYLANARKEVRPAGFGGRGAT